MFLSLFSCFKFNRLGLRTIQVGWYETKEFFFGFNAPEHVIIRKAILDLQICYMKRVY